MRMSFALLAALSCALATSAVGATDTTYHAAVYSVRDDGTGRRLIGNPEPPIPDARLSPDGRSILFYRSSEGVGALFAADASGANPVRLTPADVSASIYPVAAFSPNGRSVVFTGSVGCGDRCVPRGGLYVVSRNGSGLRRIAENALWPSWAPDSRRLAYRGVGGIFVHDLETGETRLVVRGGGEGDKPIWAPRGDRIAFTTTRRGYGVACFVNADGSRRRCTPGRSLTSLVWSPDGTRVAFRQASPRKLGIVDSYARHVRYLGYHGRDARPAAWSPDGRRLAFWFGTNGLFHGAVRVLGVDNPRRSVPVIDEPNGLRDLVWRGRQLTYVVFEP